MSDTPEWLQRIHDAVNDARASRAAAVEDVVAGMAELADEPRANLDQAVGRLLLAQHRNYGAAEVNPDDLRAVLVAFAELRAMKRRAVEVRDHAPLQSVREAAHYIAGPSS